MTILPPQFRSYAKEAKSLLENQGIGELEFSGGTYQVQIIEPNSTEPLWTFLQFDTKNRLSDAFCSCETGGELGSCAHLAAAYLKIFYKSNMPLHERFQNSLWNRICSFFADSYGDDFRALKEVGTQTYAIFYQGEEVFKVQALTNLGQEHLEKIVHGRRTETEETSLKFSNLSEEEILLWKKGRPSSHLRYELSFWNDLAKWLMNMQEEEKKVEVRFVYSSYEIPEKLLINSEDFALEFKLNSSALIAIIPSLSTVQSPLKVYGMPEDAIEKIMYDKASGELRIHQRSIPHEGGHSLDRNVFGDWIYVPKQGFYYIGKHPLLDQDVYRGKEISSVLDRYYALVKSKLEDFKIREKSMDVSYDIHFDPLWNLHIQAYLLLPGDLKEGRAQFFGEWAFIESEGFVHLEGVIFDVVEKIVTEENVGQFVQQYRAWFNHQEGFHTHITGIETKLTYKMTEDNSILFTRLAIVEDETMHSKDFGSWVYIKGQGFFSKATTNVGLSIRSGITIQASQIPLFIRIHRDELSLISNFFSEKCHVQKIGLRIEFISPDNVSIQPEYEITPEYIKKGIKFFEEYTYVEGEGFYRIPEQVQLPERFRHPLHLDKASLPRFFAFEMESIKKYMLWIDPRLTPPKELYVIANTLTRNPEGYCLQLYYESAGKKVKFSDIWNAIQQHERYLFSDIGLIDLNEDRFRWIHSISKKQIDRRSNKLILSPLELLRLNALEPLKVVQGQDILAELTEFRTPDEPDFSELKSSLRAYQKIGVHWMWFLYHHSLSGLLCDDMGLGKTHQAMALMAAVVKSQTKHAHFLVVCPTSVIYHWEEKLKEFLPQARVLTFHGNKRSFEGFQEKYDILLTSYGIWRNENELLSKIVFEVAILDEIHAAKNQASRIHATLLNVKARIRIGLTGTPIENRLRELKALFDIILPNYMPREKEYRQLFVLPIEKENNPERKKLLNRFVKPFVLRRKKEDVLPDLPEKIEEISHCELSRDQKLLYNDVIQRAKKGLYEELENQQTAIPYIHIFSVLSSLKQICNHPAVYLKAPQDYKNYESGKWDLFVELLSEALESEQKVVIFSQYLSMLDIFEDYLSENKIHYATIRGATVNRGEEIRRFNKDPSCQVFVGSLHAAGLGIDLTAGSVVIHYDRWWNAAREDQATDRVHRIGQTRGVQVFKLVTKGTFEERIDQMILRKGKLMEDVVAADDYRFMKQFDREEIMLLLRDIKE